MNERDTLNYVDDVLTGTWILTIDETNMVANTVYAAS